MVWLILVLAGLAEVLWAVGLKYTEGFTKPVPTAFTAFFLIMSLWLLALSMRTLPLGVAYTIWVGIGAIGTVILGIVLFDEPFNTIKIISVVLLLVGMMGLKLSS